MRLTKFSAAALAIAGFIFAAGCSKEEGEPSLVSEAQAAAPNQKDYGWRGNAEFPAKQQDDVREYH